MSVTPAEGSGVRDATIASVMPPPSPLTSATAT
jgi:hypothetical protein